MPCGSAIHVGNSVYVKATHRTYPYANLGGSVNVSIWDNTLTPPGYRKDHYYGGNRPLIHFGVPLYRISVTSFESGSADRHHKFILWDGKTTFRVDRTGSDDNPRFEFTITGLEDEQYAADTLHLIFTLDEAKSFIQGFIGRESHRCVCCGRPVPTFRHLTRVSDELAPDVKISNLYRLMRGLSARYAAAECRIDSRTARFAADVDYNNLWAGEICAYNSASRDIWQVPEGPAKFNACSQGNVAAGDSADVKKKNVDKEEETDESIFDDPSVVNLVRHGSVLGKKGEGEKKEVNSWYRPNGTLTDAIEMEKRGKKRIRPMCLTSKNHETPSKKPKLNFKKWWG